jgi:hypothetical protein
MSDRVAASVAEFPKQLHPPWWVGEINKIYTSAIGLGSPETREKSNRPFGSSIRRN